MIEELVEQRGSWWWPKTDVRCWDYMNKFPTLPTDISQYTNKRNVVVQAGGNCGFYPKQYAGMFNRVYTFEPEWLNFYCLSRNVTENNVVKLQACLGNSPGMVDLKINEKNRGKNFVSGAGKYPIMLIDNLSLDDCNLIHLDIEGYEYFALLGAEQTIKNFHPVIVVEMWDSLTDRFEENINLKTESLLESWGYKLVTTLNESDRIYIHEDVHN